MENNNHQNTDVNGADNKEAGEDEQVDAYFASFPPGYRFYPSDQELIENYLNKKVMNRELPINRILDVDLYSHDPETLTGKYKLIRAHEWYFFTRRLRKYPEGHRPDRRAGEGYWKPTGTEVAIPEINPQGYRRSLDYCTGKHPNGEKTNWKMHEFRLHDAVDNASSSSSNNGSDQDKKMLVGWVLCRVYKKREKGTRGAVNEDAEAANSSHPNDTTANHQWEYGSSSFTQNDNEVTVNGYVKVNSSHSGDTMVDLPSEFGNGFLRQNGAVSSDPQQNYFYFHGPSSATPHSTTSNNISNNYPHDGPVIYQPLDNCWEQADSQVGYAAGNKMGNHMALDGLPSSSNPLMHFPAPEEDYWLSCPEEELLHHLVDQYINHDVWDDDGEEDDEGEEKFKADD